MNRQQVEQFIHENFGGISQDYPWKDLPDYTVFRHTDSNKWFALLMKVNYGVLHLEKTGSVNILNLKSDPDLIEELTQNIGILPAYHMNKRHWITILLDGAIVDERIKSLIDLSYQLTAKKRKMSQDSK